MSDLITVFKAVSRLELWGVAFPLFVCVRGHKEGREPPCYRCSPAIAINFILLSQQHADVCI
jgi:hypothetical protein